MRKSGRRLCAGVLILFFALTMMPVQVIAAQDQSDNKVSLEEAITRVKNVFKVPEEYTDFNSGFNSSPEGERWSLRWLSEDKGNMNVQVDAESGDIINMNWWEANDRQTTPAHAIDRLQAQKMAENWLDKLAAGKKEQLKFSPEKGVMPLGLDGYSGYSFYWQRHVNGVPVQSNGVRMELDARTGELRNYELEWNKGDLEEPGKAISPSQARQAFEDNKMLQLIYQYQDNRPRPMDTSKESNIKLVYKINHPSNGVIDAVTGKPYLPEQGQWAAYDRVGMANEKSMGGGGGSGTSNLRPEEIKELETSKKIITKEQAAAKAEKWVKLPSNAKMQRANLMREEWNGNSRRIWSLNWTAPRTEASDAFEMWAYVDAMSGRIYNFYSYNNQESEKGKITRQEALGQAESFIQKIEPELLKQVKRNDLDQTEQKSNNLPGQYHFEYVRQVNGIPFPGQGIDITVSAVDSSILRYGLNWWDGKFPPANKAMSQGKACETYFKYAPLTLTYTRIYNDNGASNMKLVYEPLPPLGQPSFSGIDAENGERLGWDGKPISAQPAPRSFTDISGHYAAKEIERLGQAGLFSEYGSQFKPNENIKLASFLRALLGARDGIWSIQDADDAEIVKRCRERGWFTEKLEPGSTVSRELMCKLVIRSMNLEYLAKNSSIFVNPFPKDSSLKPENTGYAAICNGLNLLHIDKSFAADETISRGEAAYAIARSMQIAR